VTPVRRPPLLGVGQQRFEILLYGRKVELLEFLGVVEILTQGIGLYGVLVQDMQVQLVRPPVSVRGAAAGDLLAGFTRDRARALVAHLLFSFHFRFGPVPLTMNYAASLFPDRPGNPSGPYTHEGRGELLEAAPAKILNPVAAG
jgi:hypothetical protein